MKDETNRIPRTDGHLAVMGHLTARRTCGCKLLVELASIGVPHYVAVMVNCGDCLTISEKMQHEHPEIALKVESWLQSGGVRNEPEA